MDDPPVTPSSRDDEDERDDISAVSDGPIAPLFDRAPEHNRRTLPVHPLLFAIYPVLALLARNFSQTPLNQTTRAFAFAIGAAIFVWILMIAITRRLRKSAVITSVIVIALFSYGHLVILAPVIL